MDAAEQYADERWVPIAGYEGRYDVSDHGRVRSWVNNSSNRRSVPKILKDCSTGLNKEYRGLYLGHGRKDGGPCGRNELVHRLVLLAFVGPCPDGQHAAHLDGDPHNNHWSNLRWKTPKENNADKVAHGAQTRGESHHRSKLNEAAVKDIRASYPRVSQRALARKYEVAPITIKKIRTGQTWSHVQ